MAPHFSKCLVSSVVLVMAASFASPAYAWFIFIPGSVTGAISDAITGDSGEHCVSRGASVGDVITDVAGGRWRVESVSGESMRCTSADKPIRAKLIPAGVADRQPHKPLVSTTSLLPGKYEVTLSSDWRKQAIPSELRSKGVTGSYLHESGEWGLMYSSVSRVSYALNLWSFANYADSLPHQLVSAKQTKLEESKVGEHSIYSTEREGTLEQKGRYRYLRTVFASGDDYVLLEQWTRAEAFDAYRLRMVQLAHSLAGLDADRVAGGQPIVGERAAEVNRDRALNTRSSAVVRDVPVASESTEKPAPLTTSFSVPRSVKDPGQVGLDPATRLSKLKELFDKGLITKEEYAAKRSEILSGL